jgi:electron transfer flavoprotein beta subunit
MKAKRKELRREPLDSFNARPKLQFLGAEVQVRARLRTRIDGKDAPAAAIELVDLLRNQARVIQ